MIYTEDRTVGRTTEFVDVDEADRGLLSITDDEVLELAKQALTIEDHYGRPMDIEWGKDGTDGLIYILQARPETVQSRRWPFGLHSRAVPRSGDGIEAVPILILALRTQRVAPSGARPLRALRATRSVTDAFLPAHISSAPTAGRVLITSLGGRHRRCRPAPGPAILMLIPHRSKARVGVLSVLAGLIVLAGGVTAADPAQAGQLPSLRAGSSLLTLEGGSPQLGVVVSRDGVRQASQSQPLSLRIKNLNGGEDSYEAGYSSWSADTAGITATGTITTAAGSEFLFTDHYRVLRSSGAFALERTVAVRTADDGDLGFASRFALGPSTSQQLTDYDVFMPGNWYRRNSNVVKGAFGSDYSDENFLIKETRLPLPLVMMRSTASGDSVTLIHLAPTPASDQSESSASWLVEPGFRFGSLGITRSPRPNAVFTFPSTEGDRNYYGNDHGALHRTGPVRRSNPVERGFEQHYTLAIDLGRSTSFAEAEASTWKRAFSLFDPAIKRIDPLVLYRNDMQYFSAKYKRFPDGGNGLPFSSFTTKKGSKEYHLQSGFVGQQTKVGWEMVREGYRARDSTRLAQGVAIVDFWADRSMTASGIPRTDYFAESGRWGTGPSFLRTVSDAGEGVLDAYDTALDHAHAHPNWLAYVTRLGDFLVRHQDEDGSWARSYNTDGTVAAAGRFNTTNPIRFLSKLYLATHDDRYLSAAVDAGNWALAHVDRDYAYVGGTPDNDNTVDKEAGMMALNAFNALVDVDAAHRSAWLQAAEHAANYVESWTFSYDYKVYPSTRWASDGPSFPAWLQVDLGRPQSVSRVETAFEHVAVGYGYRIDTSLDGRAWSQFVDRTSNTAAPSTMVYVDSATATARFIRITITGSRDKNGLTDSVWPSIAELHAYGPAGRDLAQGKTATASSWQHDGGHDPSKAVDGIVTADKASPWPSAGLVGQSLVATGHSYTDTFMINGPAEFYRLYIASGDDHYLRFAQLLANNANAPADYDGRLGYQYRALLGEGITANGFTVRDGTDTLTWQPAVQLESIATLQDLFGRSDIAQIESDLSPAQKSALNHLNYRPAGAHPVSRLKDGAVYTIVNRNSGKLVDVAGAALGDGADIRQFHDVHKSGQRWRALDQRDGYWKLQNVNSGKVIDVEASSDADGGDVSQFHDRGSQAANQQWSVVGLGEGYWKLLNRASGKALDVEGSGRDDGRNISQYRDTGARNQQWAFIEVP